MSVKLVKDAAGMEKFALKEPQGSSAELYLNGGQVTSWKNARGEELLFVSKNVLKFFWQLWKIIQAYFKPSKTVRGGIPIGILEFIDVQSLDQQGWARNRLWTIDPFPLPPPVNGTKAFVDLILNPTACDKHPNFEFRLRVALGAATLSVTSRIRNIDNKKFKFTYALRNYFPVSDICDVRIEGLETLIYIDNLKNGTCFVEQEDASVTCDGEMDRFYLDTPTKIAIIDHKKKRTFALRKHGYSDAVVWNPWDRKSRTIGDLGCADYKNFVCVGAAAIGEPVKLKPGQEWTGRQEIRAVASSYCSGQLILIKCSLHKQFLKKILCYCKFYYQPFSYGLHVLHVIQIAEKIPSQMFGALILEGTYPHDSWVQMFRARILEDMYALDRVQRTKTLANMILKSW